MPDNNCAPLPSRIETILNPRSVAVIGASKDPTKYGSRVIAQLLKFDFGGEIVPIHPKETEIMGLRAVAHIAEAPGPVDLALLSVGPQLVVDICRECAAAGVGCCIIVTTGFAEADADGRARQEELMRIARETGMRILGPNCMGLIIPSRNLALCSSVVFDDNGLLPGQIGLISQSGGLMVSLYDRARTDGIGFSRCVSLGNQADLEACDFLEAMIADAQTHAICLYMEEFKDLRRFVRLAGACGRANKPLFLYKAGRTDAGVSAAMSHTASVAGSYDVLRSVCEQHGVILMDDPDDMIRAADLLIRCGMPGEGDVGLVSTSGGSLTIAADKLAENGLGLAEPGEGTRSRLLDHLLPAYARNPVDFGGVHAASGRMDAVAGACSGVLAADERVAAVIAALNTSRPYTEICAEVAEALAASGKPFVLWFTPGAAADGARAYCRSRGLPFFDSLDRAVRVLRAVMTYGEMRRAGPLCVGERSAPKRPPAGLSDLQGRLTEPEAKGLVKAFGVPVVAGHFCANLDEACAAAATLGYPVAMKAVCRDLIHKSDVGAVKINIVDEAGLHRAWEAVRAGVATALPDAPIDGVLVESMFDADVELLVGIRNEPGLGPVIAVGAGGTLVELLADVQIALAPVSRETAMAMLRKLRIWPLLDGWRGRPRIALEAVAEAIVRMGDVAQALDSRLVDLEVNPLMANASGVAAIDVRALLTTEGPAAGNH
ncbi:acetate--CoA ligase family protein [Pseudochelatococcus sp. B33]